MQSSANMCKARQEWEEKRHAQQSKFSSQYARKRDATNMLTASEVTNSWSTLRFDSQATTQQIADAAALMATMDIPARWCQHMIQKSWMNDQYGKSSWPTSAVNTTNQQTKIITETAGTTPIMGEGTHSLLP
jgi:hypothetical protein